MNFHQKFDDKIFVRTNIFPLTVIEADRQSKSLWKAGFAVRVTNIGPEYVVWRAD
jgi:hypothetical protein